MKNFWRVVGNILWVILGGFFWFLTDLFAGVFLCMTIIGIPVGLQLFKFAFFVLWPFGKTVKTTNETGFKLVLNIIWCILGGWEMALGYFMTGALWCITIVGIPFGKQYFKMGLFVMLPLGHDFVRIED